MVESAQSDFEDELTDLMESFRDAVLQLTATKECQDRTLRRAAVENYKQVQKEVEKFVKFWSQP